MIFSKSTIVNFQSLGSKVIRGLAKHNAKTPYFLEDDIIIANYELIRDVWYLGMKIGDACKKSKISRSTYHCLEQQFIQSGTIGLFPSLLQVQQYPELEELVLMVKLARPSVTNTFILRVAEALRCTKDTANLKLISSILHSYGLGANNMDSDPDFFASLQRKVNTISHMRTQKLSHRDKKNRRKNFFHDDDPFHKRLELLRQLHYDPRAKVAKTCMQFGIGTQLFYRFVQDYKVFGPWAIFPSHSIGSRKSISDETELEIILKKLSNPALSGEKIVSTLGLKCDRNIVNRAVKKWGLDDKMRNPIDLQQNLGSNITPLDRIGPEGFVPITPALRIMDEVELLKTRRLNRHFETVLQKMKKHPAHICDPGVILLAPFVSDLGIVQALETYGPLKLRGKEISNLALLNAMRILAGYSHVNHLNDNKDRSVALASGVGMFGSSSKFYENATHFKFEQLHLMRLDLAARAKELGLITGKKIAFDFHLVEFYGKHAEEKGIGQGPSKSGLPKPGFRPHIAWDLAENVLINISYYHGGARSPTIIRKFCEQNIFPIIGRDAIGEIYMDSEYTKETDLAYFTQQECKNSNVYLCLKRNKQIKKLIAPGLAEAVGWIAHDDDDERKMVSVTLPNTELKLKIVILRNRETKEDIRCFGTTNENIEELELLEKYRSRWGVENGIKDLVYSYFADNMLGHDPEKVEFEFYCIMLARFAYEYFLKELGGNYYQKQDGTKYTLSRMRKILFEKQNCTLRQNAHGDLVLTFLDLEDHELQKALEDMYDNLLKNGKNRVLWWGNRGLKIEFKPQ